MTKPSIKTEILKTYQTILQDKIDLYQDLIASLTNDAQNDAKSSAGDKHETTLSKLHLEQEKIANKLKETLVQQQILNRLDIENQHPKVALGSLVITNHLTVIISTALPKITINNQAYFGISPQSPLGLQLMGKALHAQFEVNKVNYIIQDIL